MPASDARAVATCAGVVSSVCLVAGAFAIAPIDDVGNPDALTHGLDEVIAHGASAVATGWLLTVALIAGVVFVWALAELLPRTSMLPRVGALLITLAAIANAVGLMMLAAVGHVVAPLAGSDAPMRAVALAMLAAGLSLDAAYNLLLGAGLIALGAAMLRARWPKPLAACALAAGVLSLPVVFEWTSNAAGMIQFAAEPLLLLWLAGGAVWLWRGGVGSVTPTAA